MTTRSQLPHTFGPPVRGINCAICGQAPGAYIHSENASAACMHTSEPPADCNCPNDCSCRTQGCPAQRWPSELAAPSRYEQLGAAQGRLVTEKQAAYGDSFGKAGQIMRVLYPAGIPLDKLDDALTIVRVIDKLFRIATDRDALGESPWKDINGYALLSMKRLEDQKAAAAALTKQT